MYISVPPVVGSHDVVIVNAAVDVLQKPLEFSKVLPRALEYPRSKETSREEQVHAGPNGDV